MNEVVGFSIKHGTSKKTWCLSCWLHFHLATPYMFTTTDGHDCGEKTSILTRFHHWLRANIQGSKRHKRSYIQPYGSAQRSWKSALKCFVFRNQNTAATAKTQLGNKWLYEKFAKNIWRTNCKYMVYILILVSQVWKNKNVANHKCLARKLEMQSTFKSIRICLEALGYLVAQMPSANNTCLWDSTLYWLTPDFFFSVTIQTRRKPIGIVSFYSSYPKHHFEYRDTCIRSSNSNSKTHPTPRPKSKGNLRHPAMGRPYATWKICRSLMSSFFFEGGQRSTKSWKLNIQGSFPFISSTRQHYIQPWEQLSQHHH